MLRVGLSAPEVQRLWFPQGAFLPPDLFIIFINDLLNEKNKGDICDSADVVELLYSDKNKAVLSKEINGDVRKQRKRCTFNKMVFNNNKTKYSILILILIRLNLILRQFITIGSVIKLYLDTVQR